jgi:hypothetical protein
MSWFLLRMLAIWMLISVVFSPTASATDPWTQWGGTDRDFRIDHVNLPDEVKLSERWRRDLGEGYSAILAENGMLYTMCRRGDEELVVCLDESTGELIWEFAYQAPMKETAATEFGQGPNSTPIISGDSIVAIGFNGNLHCLDKRSGEVRWKSHLIDQMGGTRVDLGYSPSPIVGKVVVAGARIWCQ